MKFVSIAGGLGNQMFAYAFCLSLRARREKAVLYISRGKNSNNYGHQGYELEKLFNIKQFEETKSKIQNFYLRIYTNLIRVFPSTWKTRLFSYVGVHVVRVPENFIFYPEVFDFDHKHQLFMGTWQSDKFFKGAEDEIRRSFVFKSSLRSALTVDMSDRMRSEQSVSIHVRRGDYLSDEFSVGFAGVCTEEYYANAIDYISKQIENPYFYIFTDDYSWVSEHFKLENATYVNFNKGTNSWQDMYLMSQCKHNIIANSSFSWWGAWLNANSDKIVIAPKQWWRLFETDDVVPETWLRI